MMRALFSFLALCAVLAMTVAVWGGPEGHEGDPTAGSTYVGESACKKCHIKQHRSWKKMKHADAWKNLPEKYRDPSQKDDDGRACISCHVTGWGEEGGFVDVKTSEHLLGVQCEACHGPGSQHLEAGKKVLDEKRKSFNEGEPSYIVLKTTSCSDCHNPHVSFADKFKEG